VARLRDQGFDVDEHPHPVNARAPGSDLRIPSPAIEAEVLGIRARVA
jgi:hypothetical protein